MPKNTRAPETIIALLEEALQVSRMKTAGLSLTPNGMGSDEDTEKIREATRVYRESWLEPPLAIVLAYLKGEITSTQAQGLYGVDPLGWSRHSLDEDVREPLVLLGAERLKSKAEV